MIGRVLWEAHPGNENTPFAKALRTAMATGAHTSGEAFSSSIGRWIEYRAYPTDEGLSLVFRDIDQRRRHDERLRFLAEASTLPSSSLDYETTLSNVAELAVPAEEFGTWLEQAESAARAASVTGPAVTPFLLGQLAELSGGRTLAANRALIVANAQLAAEVAMALTVA